MPLHFDDLDWLVKAVVAILFMAGAYAIIRAKSCEEQRLQRAQEPREEDHNRSAAMAAVAGKKGQ
jgi:hypothetical protein